MKSAPKGKFKDAEMDPFSISIVEDLLQGATDWKSIDDIVKLTFKALTDVVRVQSESIRELKSVVPTRASKSQLTTGLSLKANTSDVSRTIAQISNVLDGKVSVNEFHTIMKDYVTRYDVQHIMTNKVNVEDVKQMFTKLPERPSDRVDPLLQTKLDELQKEITKRFANCVSVSEFQELLSIVDQKASVSQINEVLETKVSKQALTTSLQKKISKSDLDLYLSKKADISDLEYIVNNLETKVDLSTIEKLTQVIENKCDKSDMSLMMSSLSDRVQKGELQLIVQAIEELRAKLDKHVVDIDVRVSPESTTTKKKLQTLQDSIGLLLSQQKNSINEFSPMLTSLKYDMIEQINKTKQWAKSTCEDLVGKLREQYESNQILLKEVVSDVNHWKRKEDKFYEQIDEVRRRIEEVNGRGIDRKEFIEFKSQTMANFQEKLQSAEVQAVLSKFQSVLTSKISEQKQDYLRILQSLEKSLSSSIADTTAEVLHLSSALSKKQDRHEQTSTQQLSKKARKEVQECRKLVDRVLGQMQSKLNIGEYENDLIEIRRKLEGFQKDVTNKANIKDVCVLADSKPNIDEVNKALKEIHEQLDSRVSDEELKTVIQDQATINETLCSENIIGRWLWNSGEIRAGCLVPWQSESVNTLPDNFLWDKDKTSILTLASGMYEISVCFFCRNRPVISVIVNGESVLTRGSTGQDKENNSRKRKQKQVVGVRLTEYLMLPSRARVSISYNGEHGAEGFLNLKRF